MLVENELKKLEKFDAPYFRGKNYFEEDGAQNYLVFQPVYKNILKKQEMKFLRGNRNDCLVISTTTRTNKSAAKTIYDNARIKIGFSEDLLRQNQVTYNHGPVVNI